jgi:protein tyrosine phosphatase (PTP) superfamily phosphohydrolase (DUF442 family)
MCLKIKPSAELKTRHACNRGRVFFYDPHMRNLLFIGITVLSGSVMGWGCAHSQPARSQSTCAQIADPDADTDHVLHNLYQLGNGLWSGGEPGSELAYKQLASLGIKAVISVDAVPPNNELADKYGIRIVHLPIGYDGISDLRSRQLARAIATLSGPIYVHCHHGKHRGPAALAVGAIGSGKMTTQQAIEFMTNVGTSENYPGLWRAVEHAKLMEKSVLADSSIELPEQADIGDFASAMAEIDRLNELLWLCAENDFKAPKDHPDLVPESLAGQIHNLLRSLEADKITIDEGVIFQELLFDSRDFASQIESQIAVGEIQNAMLSMDTLTNSCVRCHERYRD